MLLFRLIPVKNPNVADTHVSFLSSLLVRCLLRFLDDLDGLEILDDLAE